MQHLINPQLQMQDKVRPLHFLLTQQHLTERCLVILMALLPHINGHKFSGPSTAIVSGGNSATAALSSLVAGNFSVFHLNGN